MANAIGIGLRRLERVAGSLAGAALGDALGRVPERMLSHRRINARFGYVSGFVDRYAGTTTDDTVLTRLVLEAVIAGEGRPTPEQLAEVLRRRIRLLECFDFLLTGGRRGLFVNPYVSLLKLRLGVPAHRAGWLNPLVAADELAMSAAPIGCAHPGDPRTAIDVARSIGRVINFGVALDGGAAIACAVALALDDAVALPEIAEQTATRIPQLGEPIRAAQRAAEDAGHEYEPFVRGVVAAVGRRYFIHVAEAVPLTLAVVTRYGGDPMDAILRAVNLGRDADTIASMTGAIVGARHGIAALDRDLLAQVEHTMEFSFARDARELCAACGLLAA